MENIKTVSDISYGEYQNCFRHNLWRISKRTIYVQQLFPHKSCPDLDNVGEYWRAGQRPHVTIWRLRIACWITKANNTHTGCAILPAFPHQQWLLHERASILRYTYIAACLVLFYFFLSVFVSFLPSRPKKLQVTTGTSDLSICMLSGSFIPPLVQGVLKRDICSADQCVLCCGHDYSYLVWFVFIIISLLGVVRVECYDYGE
jgi:hypothetical protein